jgi:polyisoprenoid-binding protein YceI
MFRRFATFTSAALITSFALVAYAGGLKRIDTPDIKFHASGPFGMKIDGAMNNMTVSEEGDKLVMKVDLANLKSGNDTRDEHFQGYLKQKVAKLEVAKSKITFPDDGQTKSGEATGKLTLNGKADNNFKVKYKAKRTGTDYHVQGLATITLAKHGLKLCKLGDTICVGDTVDLKVKFKLRQD